MTSLLLKLVENRQSIFSNLQLKEPIDCVLLDKCINSNLLRDTFKDDKFFGRHIYQNEKTQLQAYRQLVDDDGFARVVYKRNINYDYGRYNPCKSLGFHTIRREIRHTLANGHMTDVDIKNAHPVIMSQLCKYNNIPHTLLDDYCNNRKEFMDNVNTHYGISDMDSVKLSPSLLKDIPKNLFIRLLYGGEISAWAKDWKLSTDIQPTKQLVDFKTEIECIHKHIVESNPHLYEMIFKNKLSKGDIDEDGMESYKYTDKITGDIVVKKKKANINSSVASYFLQEKECIILENVFKYCCDNDYIIDRVASLCNDGIMLENKYYKPSLLSELNKHIIETTGFDLEFEDKPMNNGYENIIDKHINMDLFTPAFTTGLIASYFRLLYDKQFIIIDEVLYKFNGVYWCRDDNSKSNATLHVFVDDEFRLHLIKKATDCLFQNKKEQLIEENKLKTVLTSNEDSEYIDKKLKPYNDKTKNITKFLKNVENLRNIDPRTKLIRDICKNLISNVSLNANPYLLAFTNKIYDLRIGGFIEPHYKQYITQTTGYEYNDFYPQHRVKEMRNIISSIFPKKDMEEMYIEALSTGMVGVQVEHLIVAKGEGSNGKSLINELMLHAIGDYGYKLPSTAFLKDIQEGPNPTFANMDNKRWVITCEPSSKHRINTSVMKEITGNTSINCRGLYSSKTSTKLCNTTFMECNNFPKLDEVNNAVDRRLRISKFISTFTSDDIYNEYTEDERKELFIMRGNPYYKETGFKIKYSQALIMILMEHFKNYYKRGMRMLNENVDSKAEKKSHFIDSDDLYGWFIGNYKREEDDNKGVLCVKDVYNLYSSSSYFNNLSKSQKREQNLRWFNTNLPKNMFLRRAMRPTGAYFEGVRYKKPFMVGWKRHQDYEGEGDEEGDEGNENTSQTTEVIH